MQIAIIGLGGIGSTFALQLSRASHDVTAIARGQRLAQIERDGAIVTAAGERAAVRVAAALDPTTPWDLVLVTVLAHQVDEVLPALQACAARKVMFMFNTFERLDRLRDAVGAERFTFGFPAILATLDRDGRLATKIVHRGLVTTVTDPSLAALFTAAGITACVHHDMESWLRTHAALVVPFMLGVARAHERHAGLSWGESRQLADGMDEGLALVRRLGNAITPPSMKVVACLPRATVAAVLWGASRLRSMRASGAAGTREPRALIDAMQAVAPGEIPKLLALRPD